VPRLSTLDLATRRFWRTIGREVDLAGADAWLDAPRSGSLVGDTWVSETARRWECHEVTEPDTGLLPSMDALASAAFDPAVLDPAVRDFYERTAAWRMEAWNEWTPAFRPVGELIAALFGRRVQQLAIPMRAMELSRGMDSTVTAFVDVAGSQVATAWLRRLKSTGEWVFSGCYRTARLPGRPDPVVHVSFPLEAGNVQVFLAASTDPDGSLWLRSPGGRFGAPGAYVAVGERGRTWATQIPIHESFHVFTDDEGVLRCDHVLSMWSARAMRLHYRLDRK
jgi:hypothetical protein